MTRRLVARILPAKMQTYGGFRELRQSCVRGRSPLWLHGVTERLPCRIAGRLAGGTGLGKTQAADAVETVFAAIGEILAEGEDVRVAGFGTFAVNGG